MRFKYVHVSKKNIHKTNRKFFENILSIYLVYISCATVLVHVQLRQVFHGAQSHKVVRNTFLWLLVLQVKRSLQTMAPITKVITPTPRVIPTPVEEVRPSLLDVFFLLKEDNSDLFTARNFLVSSILFWRTILSLMKFCEANLLQGHLHPENYIPLT